MKYQNANDILPAHLVAEIQKYAHGCMLYIPSGAEQKAGWGSISGGMDELRRRNSEIVRHHRNGATVDLLAEQFYLSTDSIRKIIYKAAQIARAEDDTEERALAVSE